MKTFCCKSLRLDVVRSVWIGIGHFISLRRGKRPFCQPRPLSNELINYAVTFGGMLTENNCEFPDKRFTKNAIKMFLSDNNEHVTFSAIFLVSLFVHNMRLKISGHKIQECSDWVEQLHLFRHEKAESAPKFSFHIFCVDLQTNGRDDSPIRNSRINATSENELNVLI